MESYQFLDSPGSSGAHNLFRLLGGLLEDFLLVFICLRIYEREEQPLYILVKIHNRI